MPDDILNAALRIPTSQDWEDHPEDLDWAYARKIFFGKSLEQAMPLFAENPIERAEELRFMPRAPFQYYIRAYARYLMLPEAQHKGEPYSAASCFLNLLEDKLKQGAAYVTPELLRELLPALEHLAVRQQAFDADVDIFGDFTEQARRIRELGGL